MQVKLAMGNDGSVLLAVDNEQGATFEDATEKLAVLRAALGDLPIVFTGGVERHVHSGEELHVHQSYGGHRE